MVLAVPQLANLQSVGGSLLLSAWQHSRFRERDLDFELDLVSDYSARLILATISQPFHPRTLERGEIGTEIPTVFAPRNCDHPI